MSTNVTTTTKTKKKFTLSMVINFLAYVAIIFIGLALIFGYIFKDKATSVSAAFELIANIISYLLVAYFSFLFVKSKRHWAHYLVWAIALTLIVVSIVLTQI